jgi:hypothetical protein
MKDVQVRFSNNSVQYSLSLVKNTLVGHMILLINNLCRGQYISLLMLTMYVHMYTSYVTRLYGYGFYFVMSSLIGQKIVFSFIKEKSFGSFFCKCFER